jgi:L-amino acid N-acyltransferase YncA
MNVTVRPAGPDDPRDVEGCRRIYAHYVETTAVSLEHEPPEHAETARRVAGAHVWLVAVHDDGRGEQVLGYAYGGPHRPRAGYRFTTEVSVYVDPSHRGRGVGRALYVPLLDALRTRGLHLALAGVTLPNPASVRLHESLGFERVATFPEVGHKLGRWHDTGWWALRLSAP